MTRIFSVLGPLMMLVVMCQPASGALSFKKGSFTLTTCTPPCTQDITDVGFQPTLYILFTPITPTAEGTAAGQCVSIGATDGTSEGAAIFQSADNQSTTVLSVGLNNVNMSISGPTCTAGTATTNLTHNSMLSNGFRVNHVSSVGIASLVHYVAFAGADLTNTKVSYQTLTTSTGNINYTGVGFQADFGIFVNSYFGGSNTLGTSLGAATSSSARWATNLAARTGQSMTANIDAGQYQRTDAVILGQTSFAEDINVDFVSWGSDGFTLNTVNAPAANTTFLAILFKGGQYQVGSTSKCTTASCTDTNSTSFTPKGVFLAAANKTSGTSVVADAVMSIGATDGTNEGTIWGGMKDATLNTQADSAFNTTKALSLYTAGTPTLSDEADSTLNSGDFQMTWTTSSATAKQYLWAVFGDAPAGGTLKDPIPRRGIIPFAR